LVQHFLEQYSHKKRKPLKRLTPAAMALLGRYPWPGNVRELENLMERLVILTEGEVVEAADLPERFQQLRPALTETVVEIPDHGVQFNDVVQDFERSLILQALEKTHWVKSRAAALLHLNRTTLLEKMKKQNIPAAPGPP
jgi:DNA-binding NtrC family response regulator